ncbi:hypothetical protein TrCOL_g2450 [Triparma columacea]|uniref:Uncharacterized protein n=1 Tax=Triparma columacea TaxID=722753 RepID=A0A9W7GDI5_9STRA|nr:hypothetical protein TrCOL_g2450 [Triparma columacea]
MGNINPSSPRLAIDFAFRMSLADVEHVMERYRKAPPQTVIEGRSCPSFQATSNYLKTILTGVIEGVGTGGVDIDAVFNSFKNSPMELNEDEEMSFPPPTSPPPAPSTQSHPTFLPELSSETINILPFLSAILVGCSSSVGTAAKFDLLFDLFYFSPTSHGTMSVDGISLMVTTVLRGVGVLLKDMSPENHGASFSVDKLEAKIARDLFADPANVTVTKERFTEWSTDILSQLEEADMSDLPKIFSLLQSA